MILAGHFKQTLKTKFKLLLCIPFSGIIVSHSETLGSKKMNDLDLICIEDIQFMCSGNEPSAQDMFSSSEHDYDIDDLDIDDLWAK